MMKQEKRVEMPSQELLEAEVKRVRYRKRYLRVLRSTIYTLVVVAALAALIAIIWLPALQIYGSSMTPTPILTCHIRCRITDISAWGITAPHRQTPAIQRSDVLQKNKSLVKLCSAYGPLLASER